MANEFIARKGLISSGSINVSGSVTAFNFIGTASAAVSSSHAVTASFALNAAGSGFPFSGSAVITGSLNVTQGVTASYFKGDGSQLTNLPASQANAALRIDNHSYEADGVTTDYNLSQSYYTADGLVVSVGGIVYAPTVDYTVSSSTLSFVEVPPSSSNIIARAFVAVTSGSVNVLSGSFVGNLTGTATSASYATTASYALIAASGGGFPFSGSALITGSLVVSSSGIQTIGGGFTGSLLGTGSWANNVDYTNVTNKPTLVSASSQIDVRNTTGIATIATTGSNTFVGDQIISGSLTTTADTMTFNGSMKVSGSLVVTGSINLTNGTLVGTSSWANNAVTASYALNAGSGGGFPFSGSAVITGSLIVSSSGIETIGGGFTGSLLGTSSVATTSISSSHALTASYALNAQSGGTGAGFPFSGSAVITGSLHVVPTGNFNGITGSFSGSGIGLTDLRGSLAIDTYNFVGNGSTTEYYLSQSYTANSLIVTVEGMTNIVDGDFTLSGPTMSFAVAPPSQSNVLVKAFLVVSSGSYATYTGSFVGDGSGLTKLPVNFQIQRQTFIGNGSTQNYILSHSYVPSGIVVTVGGLRYVDTNDYSLSGNTLQFVQAPASNSVIVVDAFINASSGSVGIFSGSFIGTASFATTASFASNVLKTKAGSITNTLFGGTPLSASVTFSTSFPNTNFAVVVTGEDARIWTIESKTAGGFTVNSNSNTALTGTTYWTCTAYGEN